MDKRMVLLMDSSDYAEILETNLVSYLDITPIILSSQTELNQCMSRSTEIGLIVTSTCIDGRDILDGISTLFDKMGSDIPVIVIGGPKKPASKYSVSKIEEVPKKIDMRSFLKTVMRLLSISLKDLKSLPMPDYMSYKTRLFKQVKESPCDLYIKIGKGARANFVKFCHAGDEIDKVRLKSIENKNVSFLYVKSVDRLRFTNKVSKVMIENIENSNLYEESGIGDEAREELLDDMKKEERDKEEAIKESSDVVDIAIDMIYDRARNGGPMSDMADMTRKIVSKVVSRSASNKNVISLLKKLISNKASFSYRFIQITSFIANIILKEMDWKRVEQIQTLTFASLFRDVALEGEEELLRIRSEEELENLEASDQVKNKIKRHPQLALSALDDYPDMPYGADVIIRQHHGSLSGNDFPERFSQRLSPLSIVLMVAEEAAFLIIKETEKEDEKSFYKKTEIVKNIKAKFSSRRFLKVVDALEEAL
jgi:hypothetical protein